MTLRISCLVLAAALAVWAPGADAEPCPGTYSGHEPEIAAQLELGADARFHYSLAYGALDEVAEGRWRWANGRVLLTSDPVTPPEFRLLSDDPLAEKRLQVDMDLPDGISLQYFNVVLQQKDGSLRGLQFAADGLDVPLDPANPPSALRLDLPVVNLSSQSFPLAPGGHSLKFRFLPHDLGKVAMVDVALEEQGNTLVLDSHDRKITLTREGRCGAA